MLVLQNMFVFHFKTAIPHDVAATILDDIAK